MPTEGPRGAPSARSQPSAPPAARHPRRDAGRAAGASPSSESQSKTQPLDERDQSRAAPSSKQSTKSSCPDERKMPRWKAVPFVWPSNIILETHHSFASEDKYLKWFPGIKARELLRATTGERVICPNGSLQPTCFQGGLGSWCNASAHNQEPSLTLPNPGGFVHKCKSLFGAILTVDICHAVGSV